MFGTKTTRVCDKCGKERTFKAGRQHGAICASGHFICRRCQEKAAGFGRKLLFVFNPFAVGRTKAKRCPICNEKLRPIAKGDV